MAIREPFKPISIDKKFGEIYFTERCRLSGFGPVPRADSFAVEQAAGVMRKGKGAKKGTKLKAVALADSLKLFKASHLGKKPPYSKIKYSEVKFHKISPQSKTDLVLGVQVAGGPQHYMVLTFKQPLKATQLDDKLAYSDEAPKHNLKNQILVLEPEMLPPHESPVANAKNASSPSVRSLSENFSTRESGLPTAKLDPSTDVSGSVSPSQVEGLPRQPARSPSLSPSPPTSPATTQENAEVRQSVSYSHSQSESLNEPTNENQPNEAICTKCRSSCESLVSTATSPVKASAGSPQSRSSSSPSSLPRTLSQPNAQSQPTLSPPAPRTERSDSRTSSTSHHTMTTDASSHYVVYGERPLFKHDVHQQQGKTTSLQPPSSSHKHRPKSLTLSNRDVPEATPASSKPLFILATGQFKPFSELMHTHGDAEQKVCSICGEVGVDDPRKIEIIRTDSKRGPVISDEGAVYMFSTTRPAERTDGDRSRRRRGTPHGERGGASSDSSSSSSSSSLDTRLTPLSLGSVPASSPRIEVYMPNKSRTGSHRKLPTEKMIYRLESSDSDSSSPSSHANGAEHLPSIKVMPLRF